MLVVTAVKSAADIDSRVKVYSEKIDNRITALESLVAQKADKSVIDNMNSELAKLENNIIGISKDVSKTNMKVELVRKEEMREKQGCFIPYRQVIESLLELIECPNEIPKVNYIDRLGSMKNMTNSAVNTSSSNEATMNTEPGTWNPSLSNKN